MWTGEIAHPRIYWHTLAKKWAILSPPLVDELKASRFLAELRQLCGGVFHHEARAWMVPEDRLQIALRVVAKYYRHYLFVDRSEPSPEPEPEREPPPASPQPKSEIYLRFCRVVAWDDNVPLSFARAKMLYRHAAMRLHPDVGGTSQEMASLNEAWQAIKDALE